jgi:hypothetical protein
MSVHAACNSESDYKGDKNKMGVCAKHDGASLKNQATLLLHNLKVVTSIPSPESV